MRRSIPLRDLQAVLPVAMLEEVVAEAHGERASRIEPGTMISLADRGLLRLLKAIKRAMNDGTMSSAARLLMRAVAAHIAHTQVVPAGSEPPLVRQAGGLSKQQLQRVRDYILPNPARKVLLAEFAAYVGLSRTQFVRGFKASMGMTPFRFILWVRVELAAALLADASLSTAEVATRCGFASASHLSAAFRRLLRMLPSEYRTRISASDETPSETLAGLIGPYSLPMRDKAYPDPVRGVGRGSTMEVLAPPAVNEPPVVGKYPRPPLLTEFRVEQTSLRIDRNVRLLESSHGLGWTDLFAGVTDELPHDGLRGAIPAVWVVTAYTPNEIQRMGAGGRHERVLPRNAISITGAGDAAYDDIAAPLKAVHLYLRQRFVDEVADELFKDGGERRQIGSSFGLDDSILQEILKAIRLSLKDHQPGSQLKIDYLSQALATCLLAKHSVLGPTRTMRQLPRLNSKEIGRIVDYIDANLASNMSVAELAGVVGLGRAQFSARFGATASLAPHQFVTMKRIRRAQKLLMQPDADLSLIAGLCGFASPSHFRATFKRTIGLTPDEYRRQRL